MEIEFDFTVNDWMEFQKNYLKNSKQFNRTKIIVTVMFPLTFFFLLVIDYAQGKFNVAGLIVLVVASVLWVLFYPKRMYKRTLGRIRKMLEDGDNTGILGLHKLQLTKKGIVHTEPNSEQKITWTGIKKMEENDTHIFLYNTAVSAIIIPKLKIQDDLKEVKEILTDYGPKKSSKDFQ
ncbi:MAG: YcxB family protein [Crocinitomicaceae bacterium]